MKLRWPGPVSGSAERVLAEPHPAVSPATLTLLLLALLVIPASARAAAFNYLPAPVDVSPGVAGAWTDVNVAAYVPSGATGVIVQWVNLTVGADADYGVRMKGSTDNWAFDGEAKDLQQGWLMTGLDATRVFQVYTGNVGVKTYLLGYTMAGVKFFLNRIDKSTATTGSWVDVGIAADTGADTAIGAIFHVDCTAGSSINYGLRKKGSTDNRIQILRANMMNVGVIGVDGAETAQQQIGTNQIDLYLVGYVTSGAVFFTNAIDKSTATTGSYVDVDISPEVGAAATANGAFVQVFPSSGTRRYTALRPNGAGYDYYAEVAHQTALVGVDGGQVFEQKIELVTQDLYLIGYSLADGADSFRVQSGRYVGTGGALSITGIGFAPDVVIVDGVNAGADAAIKTSTMGGANSKLLDNGSAFAAVHITSLDADGFSVGADPDVNQAGMTYYWVAFKAGPGAMKVGTYAGSAGAQNVTGVGFTPDYVIVMSPNASDFPMQRSSPMPANFCLDFAGAGYSNSILNMQPNGFGLGTHDVAGAGITFHYVAWARVPGQIAIGSYVGDNGNARSISGLGFQPEYVIVDRSSDVGGATGTSMGNAPAHKPASTGVGADNSLLFNANLLENDNIEALLSDGFQVGTRCRVNGNGAPPCLAPAPVNYYYVAFGPHPAATNYRSIGTAPDYSAGTVSATNGSLMVTGAGTAWRAGNRGRGDVIVIPCPDPPTCTGGTPYQIQWVGADTSLLLASGFTGATASGLSYLIRRQHPTILSWYQCASNQAACPYFDAPTASLVADDRREVGIAYKDSTFNLAATVTMDAAVTDPTHDLVLTVDPGNRHTGTAGSGVVVDAPGAGAAFLVRDNEVTLEWLEMTNGQRAVDVQSPFSGLGHLRLRQNLIRVLTGDAVLFIGPNDADIFNNFIFGAVDGIDLGGFSSKARIFNNTVYGNGGFGITGCPNPDPTLRNNIVVVNGSGDIGCTGRDPASSHNLTVNASGPANSPAGGGIGSIEATMSPTVCVSGNCVAFVDTAAATRNLHLLSTSYPNRAVDAAATLTAFGTDIDGGTRAGAWDIGADEFGVTTEVQLQSLGAIPGDASVRLDWQTAAELSNLGFHLYRSSSAEGPWTRLTSSLIPGLGSSPTGASYSWRDTGLSNGTTYYYLLEDVETTGRTERHGPVSATPQPGSATGEGGGGSGGSGDSGSAEGGSSSGSSSVTYGDPSASSLREIERGRDHVVLELLTPGFVALPESDGSVRLSIPGFVETAVPGQLALPVRHALVSALAGRQVRLASVTPEDVVTFDTFRLAAASAPEVVVSEEGLVRSGSSRRRLLESARGGGLAPRRWARLLRSLFQGETKKAQVELSPLRHDPAAGRTLLARRLVVRVEFSGTERNERSLGGSRGRRAPTPTLARKGVFAQLVARAPGLHRVRFEDLFGSGRRGLSAGSLRLSHLGQAVPYHLEPDRALFAPGSELFFLAKDGPSLHDRGEAIFELAYGQAASRMGATSGAPSGPLATEYLHTLSLEQNRFYQSALLQAPDLWLWDLLVSPVTKSYPFTVEGLAPSSTSSHLRVVLQGASDFEEMDHHLRLSLNGIPVAEATWDGKAEQVVEVPVSSGVLVEGANSLSLENVGDAGAAYSMVFLNRFEVSHPRRLTLSGGRLEGRFPQSGRAEVQGLAAPEVAYVVDETADPTWLRSLEATPTGVAFRAEAGRSYRVASDSSVLAPEVRRTISTSLRQTSNRADWMLIGPREFLPAARSLVDLRRSQGLLTRTVALEDVYSEFGFGEPGPGAMRDFLAFAFHNWRTRPRYVVLLGDTTYDPRNFLGTGVKDRVPSPLLQTSYLWTVSDPSLAAVNGDDLLPDLAIGRLSAGTLAEAERLVSKLVAFEQAGRNFDGTAVLVADNADIAGSFEQNQDEIAQTVLQGRPVEKVYLRDLGGATRTTIRAALDSGPGLVSYVGHGATAVWASENVWNNTDLASLQGQAQQPLLLTLNCLNGFFHFPPFDSLAEAFVKAEGKGAIAAFSPSGLSLNEPAHLYHKAVLTELASGSHPRMGDALLAAQQAYADSGQMPELLSIYHLFGDPGMQIQ